MKKSINKIKILIDIIMLIFMILLMKISFVGIELHKIFGIGVFIIFLVHKLLNISSIKAMLKGLFNKKSPKRNKVSFVIDILLFVLVLIMIVTGVLISTYLFKNILVSNRGTVKKLHKFSAWWSLVLMSIHLGFHLKIFIIKIVNKFKSLKGNNLLKYIILLIYFLISIYGFCVLLREHVYEHFIPDFSTNGCNQGNGQGKHLDDKERKYKNRDNNKNKEEHDDGLNIIDVISVMVLFSGGVYYTLDIIDKKKK